jgi:hypothetical protein
LALSCAAAAAAAQTSGGPFAAPFPLRPALATDDAERATLLAQGETDLAAGRPADALDRFERATVLRHRADAELASARALLQQGRYGVALARAAHAADGHREEPAAAAFYAWLLRAGAQELEAQRVLQEALARHGDQPILRDVERALIDGRGVASAGLLDPPHRVAPAASEPPQAVGAIADQALVGGVLLPSGRHVAVPAVPGLLEDGRFWVRTGLGAWSRARFERPWGDDRNSQVVVLGLSTPLPIPHDLALATRAPFAGSIGYAVQQGAGSRSAPDWPWLNAGFLGAPVGQGTVQRLGIALPAGVLGGPVFDSSGRVVGLAHQTFAAAYLLPLLVDRAVDAGTMAPEPRRSLPKGDRGNGVGTRPVAEIYKRSLNVSIQVFKELPSP